MATKPPAKPARKRKPAAKPKRDSTPTAERPPTGLDAYWLGVWRHALKVMKEQKTWSWELRPFLDEYVWSLIAATAAREAGEETTWDRCSTRARHLAGVLVLTPEARKRVGISGDEEGADPFAKFTQGDELAARRRQATG